MRSKSWNATKPFVQEFPKGHLILQCLFGVFNFFQKTTENKSTWYHSSKIEFVRQFFGRNVCLKKSFRLCLTFTYLISPISLKKCPIGCANNLVDPKWLPVFEKKNPTALFFTVIFMYIPLISECPHFLCIQLLCIIYRSS